MKAATKGVLVILVLSLGFAILGLLLSAGIVKSPIPRSGFLPSNDVSITAPQTTGPNAANAAQMAMVSGLCKCGKNLKPAALNLLDESTQGDDTLQIYRMDTTDDKDKSLTIYVIVENGIALGATYAKDGSSF